MIIGISGKIGSGKDTVGDFIQKLTADEHNKSSWEVKKFAGKLKQIVSLITGVSLKDLEDQSIKSATLNDEWQNAMGHDKVMTLRLMLQLIGTEGGRDLIHHNIWINALFADYKKDWTHKYGMLDTRSGEFTESFRDEGDYPNWIITDVRFPNELDAVKARGGITIRVIRGDGDTGDHPSETALDNAHFDFTIDNNGTLNDLLLSVGRVLKMKGIV